MVLRWFSQWCGVGTVVGEVNKERERELYIQTCENVNYVNSSK